MAFKSQNRVSTEAKSVLDKTESFQQNVRRSSAEVNQTVTFDPTKMLGDRRDYLGNPRVIKRNPVQNIKNLLLSNRVSGTSTLSENASIITTNELIKPLKFRRLMMNATYKTAYYADHVFFIFEGAYDPTYVFDSSDYIADYDDAVALIAASNNESYSPFIRWLANQAIRIQEAVIAQSNAHNPFYSMPVSEIYDRLMDYFIGVHRAVVLLNNVKILISDTFRKGIESGAHYFYDEMGAKFYYSDHNKTRIERAIADLARNLYGLNFVPKILKQYLDAGTVSLMRNQNFSFKFIVPKHADPTGAASTLVYNGSALFNLTTTNTEAAINTLVDTLISSITNVCAYLKAGNVRDVTAGLTGFNQFKVLGALTTPVDPAINEQALLQMDLMRTELLGYFSYDAIGGATPYVLYTYDDGHIMNNSATVPSAASVGGLIAQCNGTTRHTIIAAGDGHLAAKPFLPIEESPGWYKAKRGKTDAARLEMVLSDHIRYATSYCSTGEMLYYCNAFVKPYGLTRRTFTATMPMSTNLGAFAAPVNLAAILTHGGASIDAVPIVVPSAFTNMGDAALVREVDFIGISAGILYFCHRMPVEYLSDNGAPYICADLSLAHSMSSALSTFISYRAAATTVERMLGIPIIYRIACITYAAGAPDLVIGAQTSITGVLLHAELEMIFGDNIEEPIDVMEVVDIDKLQYNEKIQREAIY